MNVKINWTIGSTRGILIACLSLAILATTISISLLVLTGWQLGESLTEKIVMAAFGVLAVFGAHLLLALCRPTPIKVRSLSIVLWLFCMAYVIVNHANFFLSSQQQAGLHRIEVLNQSSLKLVPKRNLVEILSDQVKIKTDLDSKSRIHCDSGCDSLKVKLTSLKAKLDVLVAEADDFKRWQVLQDRHDDLKEAMRDDPVTTQLAVWSGATVMQVGLFRSLLFAVILEGVACLCWYIALQYCIASATEPGSPIGTANVAVTNVSNIEVTPSLSDLDCQVEALAKEIMSGQLKLTVKDVRDRCRCAQKTAAYLKRLVEARLDNISQAC